MIIALMGEDGFVASFEKFVNFWAWLIVLKKTEIHF